MFCVFAYNCLLDITRPLLPSEFITQIVIERFDAITLTQHIGGWTIERRQIERERSNERDTGKIQEKERNQNQTNKTNMG